MADIRVRYSDGNDSDTGASWALAKQTVAAALSVVAAGEKVWVAAPDTEETNGGTVTWTLGGTVAQPSEVYGCNSASGETPTTLATTKRIKANAATGAINIIGTGYIRGFEFHAGNGTTGVANINVNAAASKELTIAESEFFLTSASATSRLVLGYLSGATSGGRLRLLNIKFGVQIATHSILLANASGYINGLSPATGTVSPTSLIGSVQVGSNFLLENLDLAGYGATLNFVATMLACSFVRIRSVKVNDAWVGNAAESNSTIVGSIPAIGGRVEVYNIQNATKHWDVWVEDHCGTVRDVNATTHSGSAGPVMMSGDALSIIMSGNANVAWPAVSLDSIQFAGDVTPAMVGVQKTLTIYGVWFGTRLPHNKDFIVEVQYPGSNIGVMATTAPATPIASSANYTADTADWASNLTLRGDIAGYQVGQFIRVASNSARPFCCTQTGTTASSPPAGYTSAVDGGSVTDGSAIFRAGYRFKITRTFTPSESGKYIFRIKQYLASSSFYFSPAATLT